MKKHGKKVLSLILAGAMMWSSALPVFAANENTAPDADDIVVLYMGQIVETGGADTLFAKPLHPYTQALIAAVPSANPLDEMPAAPAKAPCAAPSPIDPPPGCRYAPLCGRAAPICARVTPPLTEMTPRTKVACHLYASTGVSHEYV